jgi:hypothetical protein
LMKFLGNPVVAGILGIVAANSWQKYSHL